MKFEIDKCYKVVKNALCFSCLTQFYYDGYECHMSPNAPFLSIDKDNVLIFQGKAIYNYNNTISNMNIYIFDVIDSNWLPLGRVGIVEGFEDHFEEINVRSKKEEDHKGQIYNSYTDSWSWL